MIPDCSRSEENYLKAIYSLSIRKEKVITNDISEKLSTKPASVSNMLKKLAEKEFISYEKYHGVYLTEMGKKIAIIVMRKHRLWETFLMEKLGFAWDKVHLIAEQLEHIKSEELVERLDDFLENPKFDPHGAPIPDKFGNIAIASYKALAEVEHGSWVTIKRVKGGEPSFLKYLDRTGIQLETKVFVEERFEFDQSIMLKFESGTTLQVSEQVAKNLMVEIGNGNK
ncbi:MAG: DtxR family Mn-dependent transcriptional regulator [Arenicella sp.]|jgi:DtxR family Mn-dependent transcriptional regulator